MERSALAAAEDGPMVVFALFQRPPYFARELSTYRRIAQRAAATVIGMSGPAGRPDLDRISFASFDPSDALSREWTVVVLTPRFGASLVAWDREEVHPSAVTLESGRLFEAGVSLRRDDALHHVLRLTAVLGDRLPSSTRAAISSVVERVREVPPSPGEARHDAVFTYLATRSAVVAPARHAAAASAPTRPDTVREEHEPEVSDRAYLRFWSGEGGTTASGTLAVALLGIRTSHIGDSLAPMHRRLAGAATVETLRFLNGLLRPIDRLSRLDDSDLVLVLPGLTLTDVTALAHKVGSEMGAILARHPAVNTATVVTALTVTRQRPLPLSRLVDALDWAQKQQEPVVSFTDA